MKIQTNNNNFITTDHTSRPKEVLFFATRIFCFCLHTLHILSSPEKLTLKSKLAKECNLAEANLSIFDV